MTELVPVQIVPGLLGGVQANELDDTLVSELRPEIRPIGWLSYIQSK